MNNLQVRLVRLEPGRVASSYGFGESPEMIAWEKMHAFLKENSGFSVDDNPITYGFNNPNPSPGSPNYGYEIWTPISGDVLVSGDITDKDFEGGLYAVTRFKGIERIGDVWMQLVAWCEESPYRIGPHQCLEHLLNPFEPDLAEYIFDLYLPVVE